MPAARTLNEPPAEDTGPVPPHDDDAERSLLSAAMHSREALEVLGRTSIDAFYRPRHKITAEALTLALEHGWRPDSVLVIDQLDRMGLLDEVGGASSVFELHAYEASTSAAPRYAQIIERHHRSRRWLTVAADITGLAYKGLEDAILTKVLPAVDELTVAAGADGPVFADLAAALSDYGDDPGPEFMDRDDGLMLLYAATVNYIFGEPGKGKSWVGMWALACALAADATARVAIVDFEDHARPVARRLVALGVPLHDIVERVYYVENPHDRTPREIVRSVLDVKPVMVLIDGVAASMTSADLDEDKSSDTNRWWQALPRPLANAGAAVVCVDHVTKSKDTRGLWPRGSGAKRGLIDGAAYVIEPVDGKGFTRTKAGHVRIRVAKDRRGFVGAEGDLAATFHVTPDVMAHTVTVRVDAPRVTDEFVEAEDKKPGVRADICEGIVAYLAHPTTTGPQSRDDMLSGVRALGVKASSANFGASLKWLEQRARVAPLKEGRKSGWVTATGPQPVDDGMSPIPGL